MTTRFIQALVATTALTVSMPAFAQNAPAAGEAGEEAVVEQDIIVTANVSLMT